MPRRRASPAADGDQPPPELLRFSAEDWVGDDEEPSPGWPLNPGEWRYVHARRRHAEAKQAWAKAHGYATWWAYANPYWPPPPGGHGHSGTTCPGPLRPGCSAEPHPRATLFKGRRSGANPRA
jgi:hypothetical protein